MTDAGLVLAAGAGRRFGGPKAPAIVGGERLVDRAVRVLTEAGCHPVVVVLGAWQGEVPGADVVENPDWAEGMGSSLRVGIEHLAATSAAERAVVTLVDLPGLTTEAVRRLRRTDATLAAAAYGGQRGHPVLIGRDHWWPIIPTLRGDAGARDYLSQHEVVLIEVADVADGTDLDTRA